MRLIGTRRSAFLASPITTDDPLVEHPHATHHGGGGGGGGGGSAGEPIGLLLALTKAS